MKTSAADQIYMLLKTETLFDDEIAQRLPSFSPNTIRRARRELVANGKVVPIGMERSPRFKAKDPAS